MCKYPIIIVVIEPDSCDNNKKRIKGLIAMPMWLRKGLVAIVAVLTLGTIVPTSYLHTAENNSKSGNVQSQGQQRSDQDRVIIEDAITEVEEDKDSQSGEADSSWRQIAMTCYTQSQLIQKFSEFAKEEAIKQATDKFGVTIQNRIGETYNKVIAPKFGKAMANLTYNLDEATLRNLEVSHNPAGGTGERILHFYDTRTGKEVVKFHVRRDQPPKDGYWFNFHYHSYVDHFQAHHTLDTIYWGKNTPPQWAA